jgi:8-oxo-dGTP pyrophosphatase MutT (NUDIX family)
MTDLPETTPPTAAPALKPRALRPRDAATLIIVERGRGKIRVLMGKRHAGHKFMPGKFVFPGGAVEPGDRRMNVAGTLDSVVEAKLLVKARQTSPEFARSLALAAIRETFEETGLALGVTDRGAPQSPPEGAWTEFAATGVFPTLEGVDFLARAITPPGRVRRFDARFFVADASLIAHRGEGAVHPDAELRRADVDSGRKGARTGHPANHPHNTGRPLGARFGSPEPLPPAPVLSAAARAIGSRGIVRFDRHPKVRTGAYAARAVKRPASAIRAR